MSICEEIYIQIKNYEHQHIKSPNAVFLNPKDWHKLTVEAKHQVKIDEKRKKQIFGIKIYVSDDFENIRVGEVFF